MRRVTGDTALCLDRRVFVRERSRLVGMASKADYVLRRSCPELAGQEAPVRVVTIVAGDEPLVDPVMEGFGEIRLDLQVAGVAELGHHCLQQPSLDSGSMNRVAVDATYIVLDVF